MAGLTGEGSAAIRVGTAGWAIRSEHRELFPSEGSHLQRYARVFDAVEVNSSFRRDHRPRTWERWGGSTPPGFRFAVKLHRRFTHDARLATTEGLAAFLEGPCLLGDRLGPLLVQLPPSLELDGAVARPFLVEARRLHPAPVVLEARHASWFTDEAEALLRETGVARVAADPPVVDHAPTLGGAEGVVYHRLHGSPRVYYSSYAPEHIAALAETLEAAGGDRWCVFDNTARGAATLDALELMDRIGEAPADRLDARRRRG